MTRNLLLGRRRRRCGLSDGAAADPPGKGVTMYMQMGGNPGDGATLARQTGAAAAAKALGVDSLNEQFSGLGAGEDDRAVQAGAGRQADLHRDHGPSRQRGLPRPGQAGGRPGHRRHPRQRAADRAPGRVRPQGLRLCRRRPLRGRQAHRRADDRGRRPQVRRRGDGLRRVQPGRARPVREGPGRHAGEGRPQGRPAGDHPGGQQRRLARRAGARRLRPIRTPT